MSEQASRELRATWNTAKSEYRSYGST